MNFQQKQTNRKRMNQPKQREGEIEFKKKRKKKPKEWVIKHCSWIRVDFSLSGTELNYYWNAHAKRKQLIGRYSPDMIRIHEPEK